MSTQAQSNTEAKQQPFNSLRITCHQAGQPKTNEHYDRMDRDNNGQNLSLKESIERFKTSLQSGDYDNGSITLFCDTLQQVQQCQKILTGLKEDFGLTGTVGTAEGGDFDPKTGQKKSHRVYYTHSSGENPKVVSGLMKYL